ncbi:hypothetical protein CEP63_014555 [Proteus mirabilis]|nr:hypothetical protein CEP63_014555 [Proteus mirabilis]
MNSNLTNYLDYYTNLDNPGYALLITGGWGSGKTYQINKYFAEKKDEICYVSLFGINSIQDIYSSIYIKMFPKQAWLKKIVGQVGSIDAEYSSVTFGVGGLLSSLGSSLIKEKVDNKKTIVLDDLERAIKTDVLTIDDILGAINSYIEHQKCKVIVIAHDEKILTELRGKREKVFGQTIVVTPDLDNAVTTFLYQKKIYEYFPKIKELLINLYLQSNHSSLRILKYIVNDCEKLFLNINEINLNQQQLEYLFRYFIISSIELKSENLSFEDYTDYFKVQINNYIENVNNKNTEEHILTKIFKKYGILQFENELITRESIVDIIKNGIFNKDEINEHIKNSNYIKDALQAPSWYKLSFFDYINKENIDEALEELHIDFKERNFKSLGDIYQMINYLLLEEKISNSPPNYEKIIEECENYIDDLFSNGTLEKLNPNKYSDLKDDSGYKGKSYWIENDYREESNKLRNYLYQKSHELFNDDALAYEPLQKMKNNLELLVSDCTDINNNYGKFCDTPLFHNTPPKDFVSTWLTLPSKQQQTVASMFKRRYSHGKLSSTLTLEKEWINNVLSELEKSANSMEHFHRYRVERLKMQIPTS